MAYILQANGFPPGPNELTTDTEAMKSMMIGEPGFQPIFNGRDFTGIKFILGPGCRPAPLGCGKTDPGSVVWVEDGVMACACNVHGYLVHGAEVPEFHAAVRLQVQAPGRLGRDAGQRHLPGSGRLFHARDRRDRASSSRRRRAASTAGISTCCTRPLPKTRSRTTTHRLRVNKPIGEWNSVEIVAKDGMVKAFLNGALITTVPEHAVKEPGHIVVQIQGAPMYWRNHPDQTGVGCPISVRPRGVPDRRVLRSWPRSSRSAAIHPAAFMRGWGVSPALIRSSFPAKRPCGWPVS